MAAAAGILGKRKFPLRRQSTSTSHIALNNPSDTSVQKPTESPSATDMSGNGSSSSPAFTPGVPLTPQTRMITASINRIREALPTYSGNSLVYLESDIGINQVIEALVEQAKGNPDHAVWQISDVLGKLEKRKNPDNPEDIPLLQSRLFLLKLLYYVLSNRSATFTKETHQAYQGDSASGRASPAVPLREKRSYGSESVDVHSNHSPAASIMGCRPISHDIAHYVLSMIPSIIHDAPDLSTMHRTAASMDGDSLADEFETVDELSTPFTILTSQLRSAGPAVGLHYDAPQKTVFGRSHFSDLRTSEALTDTAASLIKLNYKYASHVVFFLSATNWDTVFTKVQKSLRNWVNRNGNGEKANLDDFVLASCCAYDRARLLQFLHEVSSLFVSLPKEVYPQVLFAVRRAVWRWIQIFPIEFAEALQQSRRQDSNAAQRLYDTLASKMDDTNRLFMWPALTALLIISNEKMQEAEGQQNGIYGKKKRNHFWESVSRTLREQTNQLADVALLCHIDICQAAVLLPGKLDGVSILSFTPDLVNEVYAYLEHPKNSVPLYLSTQPIDVSLYSDALIVLYPTKTRAVLRNIIIPALEAQRSYACKLVVVRAIIGITVDLRGSETSVAREFIEPLYEATVLRLLSIYGTYTSRKMDVTPDGNQIPCSNHPAMKDYVDPTYRVRDYDLLGLACSALFRVDVGFTVRPGPPEETLIDDTWIREVSEVYQPIHPRRTRFSAVRTYEGFQNPNSLVCHGKDFSHYLTTWFAITNPSVLQFFAKMAIDSSGDPFEELLFARLLKDNLGWWAKRENLEISKQKRYSSDRIPSLAIGEIALLTLVTSTKADVSCNACAGLQALALAERHPEAPKTTYFSEDVQGRRLLVYEQIWDPGVSRCGMYSVANKAQQRRIRRLLSTIASPCVEYASVWIVCYLKFNGLDRKGSSRELSTATPSATVNQNEENTKWSNLVFFLACWSGCTLVPEDATPISEKLPPDALPDCLRQHLRPNQEMERFLSHCLEVLFNGSVDHRRTVVEALSNELHPDVICIFMRILDKYLKDQLDVPKEPELNLQFKTYLESILTIIQGILSRTDTRVVSALASAEFDSLLLIAKYLEGNDLALDGHGPEQDSYILALREKLCCTCVCILRQKAILGLRNENRLDLFQKISAWVPRIEEISRSPVDEKNIIASEALHRLIYKTAFHCLQASVSLSDRLVLRADSAPDTPGGDMPLHLKNFRSASWLANPEVIETLKEDRSASFQKISPHEIQNLIIQGIANLLLANPGAGTQPCLELATGERATAETQYIACVLFTQVLQKGTKLEGSLTTAPRSYKNSLCEFLKSSDISLAKAVLSCCKADEEDKPIVSSLLAIHDKSPALLALSLYAIEKEFEDEKGEPGNPPSLNIYFRSSSSFNVFLSRLAKLQGANYIRGIVKCAVDELAQKPEVVHLDGTSASRVEMASAARSLNGVVGNVLSQMLKTVSLLPVIIFQICDFIAQKARERDPDGVHVPLVTFVFLRFICAALSDPSYVDYEGRLAPYMRTGLRLTAKVLLQLGSNSPFRDGMKLDAMNPYLFQHSRPIKQFIRIISTVPRDRSRTEALEPTIDYDEADGIFMARFFEDHADQLGKELLVTNKAMANGNYDLIQNKPIWDGVCAALVEVETPAPPPLKDLKDGSDDEMLLQVHLRRYKHHTSSSVEHLFRRLPCSTSDHFFFLTPISQIYLENIDFHHLVAYVLKILSSSRATFDIIFDCTGFSSFSELPVDWINLVLQLTPSRVAIRFKMAYIVCPNRCAQNYIRKLYAICHGVKLADKAHVVPNFKVLREDHDDRIEFPSDCEGLQLEESATHIYEDVEFRGDGPDERLILEIVPTHLKITSTKRSRVLTNNEAMAIDIIWLAEITDVYSAGERQSFVLSRREDRLHFYSRQSDDIVKNIKLAKAASKFIPAKMLRSHGFSAGDLTSTLVHFAFWTACIPDQQLSTAAHGLIFALVQSIAAEKSHGPYMTKVMLPHLPSKVLPDLSERIASVDPNLTLPLLTLFCDKFKKGSERQRLDSLQFIVPWIRNLATFWDPLSGLCDNGTLLRPTILNLIELNRSHPELTHMFKKYIWSQLKDLDTGFMSYALDLMIPVACESEEKARVVAGIVTSVPSYAIWTKLFAKLRKAMGKPDSNPSSTKAETQWTEIQALVFICYQMTMILQTNNSLPKYQNYPPDILSVIPILAGVGCLSFRMNVYGLAIIFLQMLFQNGEGRMTLPVLEEWGQPQILHLFGLEGDPSTGRYQSAKISSTSEKITIAEDITRHLLGLLKRSGHKSSLQNAWRSRFMSLTTSCAFLHNPLWIKVRALTIISIALDCEGIWLDHDFFFQLLAVIKQAAIEMASDDELSRTSLVQTLSKLSSRLNVTPSPFPRLGWLALIAISGPTPSTYKHACHLLLSIFRCLDQTRHPVEQMLEIFKEKESETEEEMLERHKLAGAERMVREFENRTNLSFSREYSSFSIAHFLFKGVGPSQTKPICEAVLTELTEQFVSSSERTDHSPHDINDRPMHPDAIGFFLARLPFKTDEIGLKLLMKEADAGENWWRMVEGSITDVKTKSASTPRIPLAVFGHIPPSIALVMGSFISMMLKDRLPDGTTSTMLFMLLADLSGIYPDIVALCCESLVDRMLQLVSNTSNTELLAALDVIFRQSLFEEYVGGQRVENRHSSSSLGSSFSQGDNQRSALRALGMEGIVTPAIFTTIAHIKEKHHAFVQFIGAFFG